MGQCSSTLPTNHSTNNGMVSETTTPMMTGGTTSSTNQYDMRERDVVLSDHHNHHHNHNKRGNHPSSTNSNKNHGLDFNILTPTTNVNDPMKSRKMMNHSSKNTKSSSYYNQSNNTSGMMAQSEMPSSPQSRDPPNNQYHNNTVSPMDIDTRDEAASPVPMTTTSQQQLYNYQFMIPSQLKYPLPANAIRTRCYKLNLNADPMGISSNGSAVAIPSKPMFLGPFTETLPTLTFSNDTYDNDLDDDDDDDEAADGMTKERRDIAVAIQTAQIFRGITVSADGTILSQNARATRSSRGNNNAGGASSKVKLSEKSRQAAKIDKANDLIEQDGSSDAKLVSLVVIGEYDDMKYLVRDGSRKLREADGLPDDALYAINRPRVSSKLSSGRSPTSQSSVTNNNNFSSMFTSNNNARGGGGGFTSSSTVVSSSSSSRRRRVTGSVTTPGSTIPTDTALKSQQQQQQPLPSPPQQQLPKLKSNPRDTTSSSQRRTASSTPKDSGLRGIRLDSCHDFMDVHTRNNNKSTSSTKNSTVISGFGSDNDDWTHAWNLWNCGGGNMGTISPLQPSSPSSATNNNTTTPHHKLSQPQSPPLDSRNDQASSTNYGGYHNSRRVG
jgi:hypothetical protein